MKKQLDVTEQEMTAMGHEEVHSTKDVSIGTFLCLLFIFCLTILFGMKMGIGIMFSVIMKTAHDLLINTAFYIMAVAVLAGAVSSVFSEFGVTALLNKLISPIMKPIFGLPGAASLGAVATFFSDNPAVVPIAKDPSFAKYFKKYQWASLINLGTTFGMGIIIVGSILGIEGGKYTSAVLIGIPCAFIGGIIGNRLMLFYMKRYYGAEEIVGEAFLDGEIDSLPDNTRKIRTGSVFQRGLNATFDGGKNGVDLGLSIIPGILIFCTLVMMLTNGPSIVDGKEVYLGNAYEGIGLLPMIGEKLSIIIHPLFGFENNQVIALPLISLGAVGASLAGASSMANAGNLSIHDMTVYLAIGYCWSGFLSTTACMADAMRLREITTKAMVTQFLGGLIAGILANILSQLLNL